MRQWWNPRRFAGSMGYTSPQSEASHTCTLREVTHLQHQFSGPGMGAGSWHGMSIHGRHGTASGNTASRLRLSRKSPGAVQHRRPSITPARRARSARPAASW